MSEQALRIIADLRMVEAELRLATARQRERAEGAEQATVDLVRELTEMRGRAEKAEAELRAHLESGWDGEERYNQAVFRAEAAETERDGWHTRTFALAAEVAELRRELRERDYYG